MPDKPPIIFVVDDDRAVGISLTRLLGSSGWNVETYASAEAYLQRRPHDGVGCILLDVEMDGLGGPALQERLTRRGSDLPIVFLTGHGSILLSVCAMKQGAADFLTKPVDEKVLLATVREALARHEVVVGRRCRLAFFRSRFAALTPREMDVVRWILTGALNKQVASRLGIAEKTVKVHRGRVMEKLAIVSVAELVHVCVALGVEPAGASVA